MDKILRIAFSMRSAAIALIVFLVAIAWATFIESWYDTETARVAVYNAFWFEVLLTYLGINLISNIFTYRMFKREKISILIFHVAFIVMLIGAAVTRYMSFEGVMLIREGEQSNVIHSSDPYFWFKINDGKIQYSIEDKKYMSQTSSNYFEYDVEFPEHKTPISIEFVEYQRNMVDSLVTNDSISESTLEIITGGMSSNFITEGNFMMIGQVAMSYNKKDIMPGIEIVKQGMQLLMKSKIPMSYLPMAEMQKARQSGSVSDSLYIDIPTDTLVPFQTSTLYRVNEQEFVFKGLLNHTKMMKLASEEKDTGKDYLVVNVKDGEEEKQVTMQGGSGVIPEHLVFNFNGLTYEMEYGSKKFVTPFFIACRDFELEKYPGSMSPSSFASEVTIVDEERDYRRDQRIFMNNVMDYRGYRFFQSSYDPDEKGTRLSVNHDWWGTNLSYLGYLMMGLGMLFSLITPNGRFRELNKKLKKSREKRSKLISTLAIIIMSTSIVLAQENHEGHDHSSHDDEQGVRQKIEPIYRFMSEEHSESFASLLVQDHKGRIIPFHTLADQVLRKISRNNKFNDLNAIQTIMSMHMYPEHWLHEEIIYVSGKSNLREKLGVKDGYASYLGLTDTLTGEFILLEEYQKAHQKRESKRGEFDKRLLQLGEKYQVFQMVLQWQFMKIVPLTGDENNTWYIPMSGELMTADSISNSLIISYFSALNKASEDGKYGQANDLLQEFKHLQRTKGEEVVPDEKTVEMEISYNKMNIFKSAYRSYLLMGLFLLILFFVRIFILPTEKKEKIFKWISMIATVVVGLIFLYHGYGVYMRAIITGHAPWSDAYEAVVFIALITVFVGIVFTRKNAMILAGAAILAALMLYVSEMNLMDPEITPLPPVLKSYWLMIHVAIITGSYAPLGLTCILALINLILYILRTERNKQLVNLNINELTYVSEMIMTIGVFMLAIGTFLGGIWANESWGRYWGWDPKETWALVAILVYVVILHLRFIPKLNGKFLFNTLSFWGYSSILFTFFGVNYFLVGMHSYANGEGQEMPNWAKIMIFGFAALTALAYIRYRMFNKASKTNS